MTDLEDLAAKLKADGEDLLKQAAAAAGTIIPATSGTPTVTNTTSTNPVISNIAYVYWT